jgi:hypothetical protein
MLKRLVGVLVALSVLVGGITALAPVTPVMAARGVALETEPPVTGGCVEGGQGAICGGKVDANPGDPGRDPSTGMTPAPQVCVFGFDAIGYETLPCVDDVVGWWSNADQCYYSPQEAPGNAQKPAGALETGSWYRCAMYKCRNFCWNPIWLNFPPPGIVQITPGAAAYQLLETIPLAPITIGLAPDPNVAGSRSYVGVPIWMWAAAPTPETYGPYAVTETLGGITITATARVTSIIWTMGDGSTVACATAGTPYQANLGFAESPNCGHRYSTVSTGQLGGRFPVTATSQWTMDWAVGATTGTLETTRVAESSVEVRELQSVNVGD